MATSTNDTQSTGTAAASLAGVSPAAASRKRVTQTARGLLVGGVLVMGTGLGLGAALAGNEEPAVAPAPERITETVTVHMETVTVTAQPEAPAPPEPTPEPEPALVVSGPITGKHAQLSSGDQYQVESGDTMAKIAQRAGVSLGALINANPGIADPNLIYSGNIISIP